MQLLDQLALPLAGYAERAQPCQWWNIIRTPQQIKDVALQAHKLVFGDEFAMAGPRERQADIVDHLPGPRAHDDDPVGKEERLLDIVGHEHGRGRNLGPDIE